VVRGSDRKRQFVVISRISARSEEATRSSSAWKKWNPHSRKRQRILRHPGEARVTGQDGGGFRTDPDGTLRTRVEVSRRIIVLVPPVPPRNACIYRRRDRALSRVIDSVGGLPSPSRRARGPPRDLSRSPP